MDYIFRIKMEMAMNLAWRRILCVLALAVTSLAGAPLAHGQARPAEQAGQKPILSEEAFKNVQVLRGIPVKEFMETMGFFAASLSLNCTDCHGGASASSWANYATDTDLPLKQMARRMVVMVNTINSANFAGARSVTCYTCHRGNQHPKVIPSLAAQYAEPPDEDPDEVEPIPGARVTVTPEQILDKYIQAAGGAAALAKLTSFTGKGTYEGFDSDFAAVPVDVYAKAPNMRATVVHMSAGESTTTFDGREAWAAAPLDLVPVPLMSLTGSNLEGARLDAQLTFPGQIKQVLTDWRAGFPTVTIDGRAMDVIEGKTPGGVRVKLYFDKQTGLLARQAHFTPTMVGTVATHVAYSDYRPVAGVQVPFEWQVTWVDGQSTIKLTSLQPNVPIDAARFAKPAPPTPR
jgi:photosynthetic reaction center cytochrome c subunit